MRVFHDEGGREQDVVALFAVNCAAHWIADQAGVKSCGFDFGVQLQGGVKGGFGFAVCHHFQTDKEVRGREKPSDHVPVWVELAA